MDMTKNDHQAVGELIKKVAWLLGKFASKKHAHHRADKKTGVRIRYGTVKRNEIRFDLVTEDKIGISVVFDLNQVSREYLDNMVKDTKARIESFRKKRQEDQMIVIPARPMAKAVNGAFGNNGGAIH